MSNYLPVKIIIEHYRVPGFPFLLYPKRGKPKSLALYRYSRKFGFQDSEFGKFKPYVRGGMTVCMIVDSSGKALATGVALCSMSDNYSYKTGRDLAFERAKVIFNVKNGSIIPKSTEISQE